MPLALLSDVLRPNIVLLCNRKKEFEFWGQLIFGIQPVREINAPDATVRVDLHSKGLDIVCPISSTSEVR